jgi:hypothetical protein
LDDLLFDWGLLADDALLVETDPNTLLEGGDLVLRRFARHPITQTLIDNNIPLVTGLARSIRADPGRPLDDALVVTELIASSEASWGERTYLASGSMSFDPQIDLAGPVRVASVSERRVDSRLGISIPGGRVVAIGSSDFVSNNRIGAGGNLTFILNSIHWALDRESLLSIPARSVTPITIALSQEQLTYARFGIWLGPPVLVGMFGLMVFIARRQ